MKCGLVGEDGNMKHELNINVIISKSDTEIEIALKCFFW